MTGTDTQGTAGATAGPVVAGNRLDRAGAVFALRRFYFPTAAVVGHRIFAGLVCADRHGVGKILDEGQRVSIFPAGVLHPGR